MKAKILHKKNIIMIAFLVLVVIPTTYAIFKYKIVGSGALDAAEWSVALNQNGQNNNLSVVPDPNGTTASYTINVRSDSEVDVTYTIVIDNLPSGTSVSLDGGNYVPESNNKVILSNVGTIPYTDTIRTRSHIIRFKAASTATAVTNQEISINVVMKQALQ